METIHPTRFASQPLKQEKIRKALVFFNPAAGSGVGASLRESLDRHFAKAGIAFEIHETHKDEPLGDIVRARLHEGFDLVVAAGGDGTIADVLNGLVGNPVPLGIVPVGTGNLAARELGLPSELDAAVAMLAGSPECRRIDVMRINSRFYMLNASVGISASVVSGTSRADKKNFGRIAYFATAFRKVLQVKTQRISIEVDGQTSSHRVAEAVVMNCGTIARMLYPVDPIICADDGHLDVWIIRISRFIDYPIYFLGLFFDRPVTRLATHFAAQKRITIRSKNPQPVQADGDMIGTTPIEIEIVPSALTVLVPPAPPNS